MDYEFEYLLSLNGYGFRFRCGYRVTYFAWRVEKSSARPHGVRYALVLRDERGRRVLGFDNAHRVKPLGGGHGPPSLAHDHLHRDRKDKGRPYLFVSPSQLLADFEAAVQQVLKERGLSNDLL